MIENKQIPDAVTLHRLLLEHVADSAHVDLENALDLANAPFPGSIDCANFRPAGDGDLLGCSVADCGDPGPHVG